MEPFVFIACPNYGSLVPETVESLINAATNLPKTMIRFNRSSLLALNCNVLWAEALNARVSGLTHFIMLHSDIGILEEDWVSKLIEEQQSFGADILSVVVPVKDERGVSSTAVADSETHKLVRLTMSQIAALPPTFNVASAGYDGKILLVNTGLFCCDFTKPWVETMCFRMDDLIVNKDGHYEGVSVPEDWQFSLRAAELGLRVAATRCLRVKHYGRKGYANDEVWGCEIDPNNNL